jgi:hypothetical protein
LVYFEKSMFFVPFISDEYFSKPFTRDEFQVAMSVAVRQREGYILPVRFGGAVVPPEYLSAEIHHLFADDYAPSGLAAEMHAKVHGASTGHRAVQAAQGAVFAGVSTKPALPIPKIVPSTFSVRQEMLATLGYVGDRFEAEIPRLRDAGYVGTVERYQGRVLVTLERSGEIVYSLDIRESPGREATLQFGLNQHRAFGGAFNATAQPCFDPAAGVPKLNIMDFSLFGKPGADIRMTKDELFEGVWERMVAHLESRR